MSDHSRSDLSQSALSRSVQITGKGEIGLVDGFLATKIFILLKKIVVDVGKMNEISQFSLMFPGEG